MDSESVVKKAGFGRISRKLLSPYMLSFSTIEEIETVWVYAEYECGEKGIGEAVALPGYGHEMTRDIERAVGDLCKTVIGLKKCDAENACRAVAMRNPFAASAVSSALDFPAWLGLVGKLRPVKIVFPLSAKPERVQLIAAVRDALASGFRKFKMKVGFNIQADIKAAEALLKSLPDCEFDVRFDANQGYTFENSCEFLRALEDINSPRLEWVEQPLPVKSWEKTRVLCRNFRIPIMLDESIFDRSDIEHAKEIGCTHIKLKLFKHPGLDASYKLAEFAHGLGMKITIGNGVSTDIGNLSERLIQAARPGLFCDGQEFNGYAKLEKSVAFPGAQAQKGCFTWSGPTELDMDKIIDSLKNESVTAAHGLH